MTKLSRREFLKSIAAMMGGAAIAKTPFVDVEPVDEVQTPLTFDQFETVQHFYRVYSFQTGDNKIDGYGMAYVDSNGYITLDEDKNIPIGEVVQVCEDNTCLVSITTPQLQPLDS